MTATIQRRLAALEALLEAPESVLVVFEPLDDEQRQEAQAAEAAGVLVLRVVFSAPP